MRLLAKAWVGCKDAVPLGGQQLGDAHHDLVANLLQPPAAVLSLAVGPKGTKGLADAHRYARAVAAAFPAAEYDPATGTYVGPDGHVYTRSDLGAAGRKERTWQTMLLPPN